MNTQDLKKYIDRVLGSSIRCLLPSYWWKRIFHAVVDKCDAEVASVASAVDSIEQEVGSKVDYVIVSGQDSDIEKNKEAYKFIKARGYNKPLYIWYRNTPEGNQRFRVDYKFGAGYWDVIDGAMKWYIELFNVNFTEGDRTLNTFFVKLYEDGTLSGLNTIYEDSYISDTSERAVQNKVIKKYIDDAIIGITKETTIIPIIPSQNDNQTIEPNAYYRWTEEMTNLTVLLSPPENSSILNSYMFEFKASANGCTLAIPDTVIWKDNTPPNIVAGKTYQISIINNLAVAQSFG